MSSVPLRGLATQMAATNIHLTERPKFLTGIDVLTGTQETTAEAASEIRLEPWKNEILGQLHAPYLRKRCRNLMGSRRS